MNKTEIRNAFCGENLRCRIALDYDIDIAPMLADDTAQFASFSGRTVDEAVNLLAASDLLQQTKRVVLNIVTNPRVELKMSDLTPVNELVSTLPTDVQVI